MKMTKLISILLAVLMLLSSFAIVTSAESEGESGPTYSTTTGNGKSNMLPDPSNDGQYLYKEGKYKDANGKTQVVTTPEQKIALMDYRFGTDDYELYVDAYSGEVAIRAKATGEILFTNPYNIGQSTADGSVADKSVKDELLSQIIVNYTKKSDETKGSLYSYSMAAKRNQIVVKNIKGGIRVEYTIGREENRSLLPRMVEASVMEEIFATIEANMEEAIAAGQVKDPDEERQRLVQFKAYYNKYSLDDAYDPKTGMNEEIYNSYVSDYPILAEFEDLAKTDPTYEHFAIYVVDEKNMGENVIKKQENLIKDYCKEYTYEQLDEDHAFVKYETETENYPLFKLALEYFVEESGLVVKLPANGIRFDESLYRLDSIDVLPYMGAGMNPNAGYTFFPDGSGTLFDFQEIAVSGKKVKVSSKIYGADYAYHQITGNYEEIVRYPVFGVYEEVPVVKETVDENGNVTVVESSKGRGFVAVIEEGDSLMELATYHGGVTSEYNTVMMSVYPRPTDSYNMKDAISVGQDTDWTVVSDRKYTGTYSVRYIMLTDEKVAKENNVDKFYDTSYVGMANAYRDLLIKNGVLTKLTENDVEDDIPLYIETFGAMETTERFLTVPINVMTPLTSFGDVKTMYENLKDNEITNVNFILTGFTKGGMTDKTVPYHLKWESAVKKEMDFDELNEYAKSEGFGIFPDFDFVFAAGDKLFDGLSYNKHAAKTIDDRYTSRREYSATKHTYVSYFEIALSPAYFSHFYEKFIPKYAKTSPVGISVSTLGSYLNSDFDEDEPYNRADSQRYTIQALEYISSELENTEVMTAGGNAYSWKYVDHITDIALDSSRYSQSAAAVPFLGIVLHGYVEIAGTPVNMEGNLEYAFLKALESGAALKFILSYRNTESLKEDEILSNYYSIDYKNWYVDGTGDLVTMYKELNALLKDVQTSQIVGHTFLDGVRVPDDDELELDAEQAIKDAIAYEEALANANSDAERKAIFNARQLIIKGTALLKNAVSDTQENNLKAQLETLKKIYDPATNQGEYAELLAKAEQVLKEASAYQQLHAITADGVVTTTEGKLNKLANVTVEAAITAYKAFKEAEATHAVDSAEYIAAKEAYEPFKLAVGEDYILAAIAYQDAAEADKEAKKEILAGLVAGTDVAPDVAVELMNKLEEYKKAWVDANASGDATATEAAKATFDAKLSEIYGALVATLAEEITFEGNKVGGTRYYRDDSKARYTEATAALTEKLNALYASASATMDAAEQIREKYNLEAIEEAYALIVEKGAFSDSERDRLLALITDIKAVLADNDAKAVYDEILTYDINGTAEKAYEAYVALYDATNAAGVETKLGDLVDYELSGFKATDYLKGGAYSWTTKIVEEQVSTVAKPVPNTQKYESDANKIVHEVFENGTEFLLNFNDYRIIVEVNGVYYDIDKYGYIVLKTANA